MPIEGSRNAGYITIRGEELLAQFERLVKTAIQFNRVKAEEEGIPSRLGALMQGLALSLDIEILEEELKECTDELHWRILIRGENQCPRCNKTLLQGELTVKESELGD